MPKPAIGAAALAVIFASGLLSGEPAGSAETRNFIVKCGFSHRKHADPIVSPNKMSAHMHDFYGNRSTASGSSYASMIGAATSCAHSGDTAGYWAPTLFDARNKPVTARTAFAYYRNKSGSSTVPFPPDFRMLAGGGGAGKRQVAFWTCHELDSEVHRYTRPPKCVNDFLVGTVFFPNCWDGRRKDSRDHRSHVAYRRGSSCPASHPVQLPDIRFFIRYPEGSGGRGWHLSDGTTALHADFWNTWKQLVHEQLVRDCLNGGGNCGKVRG